MPAQAGRAAALAILAVLGFLAAAGQPALARDWRGVSTPESPGISVLSPVQVFEVGPDRPVPGFAPPADASAGVDTAGGPVMDSEGRLPAAAAPAVPAYDWGYEYGGYDPVARGAVTLVQPVGRSARLGALAGRSGLSRGAENWAYRQAGGPTLAFGSFTAQAPAWSSAPRLGGVQVSNWVPAGETGLQPGQFAYSSSVGLLNYSDASATEGDLVYGASAGSGALRYGLAPGFVLESQLQAAPSLTAMGLGGRYIASDWGTLQAAVVQSQYEEVQGWRYALGYTVDLGEGATVGLSNELIGPHYSDLSQYDSGYSGETRIRNTLTAGLPLGGRLGTLAGTYSGLRAGGVATEQRFGLTHTVLLSPSVNLSLGADRDIVSGDYAMRMQLSLPFDTFASGRWWR